MDKQITLDDIFDDNYIGPDDEPTDQQDEPVETQDAPDLDETSEVRKAYYDFLVENEILDLPKNFEYDGSSEKLEEALELAKSSTQKKVIENFWNSVPEDLKEAFEFTMANNATLEDYFESRLQNPATLDLTRPENQRKVVERFLKETTRFSPEKIKRTITSYEEDGILDAEAADAASELEGIFEQQNEERRKTVALQAEQAEEARRRHTDELVKAINSSQFIHPARREKVRSFFFSPIKKDNQQTTAFNVTVQNILTNPEHQAQLADLLLDYSPQQGFSLERFEKRVKARATSSFKDDLDRALDPKRKAGIPAKVTKTDTSEFLEN